MYLIEINECVNLNNDKDAPQDQSGTEIGPAQ